jgi:hypothetical protein
MKRFAVVALMAAIAVVTTGCMTIEILCDNVIGTGNQVLTHRSTAANKGVVGMEMEGGGSLNLSNLAVMAAIRGQARVEPDKSGSIRIGCGNEVLNNNNVGALRSAIAVEGSDVKYKMTGGGQINVADVK